jgi:hypothetical protein
MYLFLAIMGGMIGFLNVFSIRCFLENRNLRGRNCSLSNTNKETGNALAKADHNYEVVSKRLALLKADHSAVIENNEKLTKILKLEQAINHDKILSLNNKIKQLTAKKRLTKRVK